MLLGRGEIVIFRETSRLISSTHVWGTLLLTNHRLVFESEVGGGLLGGGSGEMLLNIDLRDIRNLDARYAGFDLPWVSRNVLTVEASATRHALAVSDPGVWVTVIHQTRSSQLPPPPGFPLPAGPPPSVTRCRYCGSVSPLAGLKCPSCGASI
jgi:hypothetical protein